jgi:predicted transcriptional regulator
MMGEDQQGLCSSVDKSDDLWECIECLSGSPQRVQLLNVLTVSRMDLRSLKDELDSPRTTLQRNLALLEDQGWIKKTPSGYTVTPIGRLLAGEFVGMIETIERIGVLSPFLNEIDKIDMSKYVDTKHLDELVVTVPDSGQPYRPTNRLLEILDTATYRHGFLPVVSAILAQYTQQAAEPDQNDVEVVLYRETVDTLRRQYPKDMKNTTEESRIEIFVCADELPYGLLIFEDRILLAAYDDIGRMQALVESKSDEATEWGQRVYEEYRQQSTRLYDSESGPNSLTTD